MSVHVGALISCYWENRISSALRVPPGGELVERLDWPQPMVSKHLDVSPTTTASRDPRDREFRPSHKTL